MIKELIRLFSDPYFQKIFFGTLVLGFAAGSIGVFPTLRKQALIGDALSHAALPGVVLAFMIFNTKKIEVLLLGAAAAAIISMFLIEIIKKYSKIKFDASMALILSSFFGFGNVLMNSLKGSGQAGIDKFIFGEAATMLQKDVNMITIVAIVSVIVVILFWRHIKLFIFNEEFYESLGFNSTFINGLLAFLTVLVVVISIRTIGVVLMSALLIAPAVSARQWSDKLSTNFILAGIFGAFSGGIGTIFSFKIKGLPTGPVIVVSLSIVLIISLMFSPKRGIIASEIKKSRQKKLINKYHELVHLYEYEELKNKKSNNIDGFIEQGYLKSINGKYELTKDGESLVHSIMKGDRLWG